MFCELRMLENLLNMHQLPDEIKEKTAREFFSYFSQLPENILSPQVARDIHVRIKKLTGISDPYKELKQKCNTMMLEMLPELRDRVSSSPDPFITALKLAIAGNIIDFAKSTDFNIYGTIERVLNSSFAIDHSAQLRSGINKAATVLYIGDNAGEIVLDRLFLEQLNHPGIIFAVRNEPILNDATTDDAIAAGIPQFAKVISTGSNAPSAILSEVSAEFSQIYNSASLIISKGQGNLEGLIDEKDKNIFFMLMIKCDHIAGLLKVKTGDYVIKNNRNTI